MGPLVYIKHLLSEPRLPFTAAYFGSIGMTLFSAIGVSYSKTPTPTPCSIARVLSHTHCRDLGHSEYPEPEKDLLTVEFT